MNIEYLRFVKHTSADSGDLYCIISNTAILSNSYFKIEVENINCILYTVIKVSIRYKTNIGKYLKLESSFDLPNGFRSSRLCNVINNKLLSFDMNSIFTTNNYNWILRTN